MKADDLTNTIFGRLTVLAFAGNLGKTRRWLCKCVCGKEKIVAACHLKNGKTKSCGCLVNDNNTTHGDASGNKTKEYHAWATMIQRCENPNIKSYPNYGGRGIRVCAKWRNDYVAFIADVGRAPSPQHSLDRIDNDRDYQPDNVRWATAKEQRTNQRPRRQKLASPHNLMDAR